MLCLPTEPLALPHTPCEQSPMSTCSFSRFTYNAADDEDDEALQAVLLASLCAASDPEGPKAEAEEPACVAAQQALLDNCEAPPLVGKPSSLSQYATECSLSGSAKSALQALEDGPDHLMLCRVRGDGHCLFRAIAASLTMSAAWAGNAALADFHGHLDSLVSAAEVVDALRALLGRTTEDASRLSELLNQEDGASDAAVCALRRCATGYMRQQVERFRLCCDGDDFESYCVRMEAMAGPSPDATPAYGGHSEIVALSECLRVRVEIWDCSTACSTSSVPTYRLGEHLPSDSPIIYLLRRGPHYHLMVPSQAEGERLASYAEEEVDL